MRKSICIFAMLIILYATEAFAYRYKVEGTFVVADKEAADVFIVDLAALSPITMPDKLEIIQKKEVDKTIEEKATGEEYISLEIAFVVDKEAEDYFNTAFATIKGNGHMRKHKCRHSDMGESQNYPCEDLETMDLVQK